MLRTVIVTGSASGLGKATALRLLAAGYRVIGIDVQPPSTDCLEHEHFFAVTADLGSDDFEAMVAPLINAHGYYALVYCAGISHGGRLDSVTDEEWSRSIDVNLTPAFKLCRMADSHMVDGGRIVLVNSPVSLLGANKPSYAASKAGLHGLMMSVSRHLGKRQIQANTILPGPMITGMTDDWSEEKRSSIAAATHLGRLCLPEEVANVIEFMLGPSCTFLAASVIDMTSGSMYGH